MWLLTRAYAMVFNVFQLLAKHHNMFPVELFGGVDAHISYVVCPVVLFRAVHSACRLSGAPLIGDQQYAIAHQCLGSILLKLFRGSHYVYVAVTRRAVHWLMLSLRVHRRL